MRMFKILSSVVTTTSVFALLAFSSIPSSSDAFVMLPPSKATSPKTRIGATELRSLSSPTSTETSSPSDAASAIPSSRFVVQNRFRVREGREAAFEKRWADRESRLGTLDGFRFFCMLRKVGGGDDTDPNYVSCTVWENYENFEAWRTGDAFKEAHGGGTVRGVASMLAASLRNAKGKPKPAFWRGLLPEVVAGTPPPDGEGWRRVEADGETKIPADCFVAMNRFSVRPGMEDAFEGRFAARESVLKDYDGFRGFLLLRRDGDKKAGDGKEPDDGYTHSTFSVWTSKDSFDAWMSDSKKTAAESASKKEDGSSDGKDDNSEKKKPPSISLRPPIPAFYEGILSLESSPGI